MNTPQRVTLIVGAVILLAVLASTESHNYPTGDGYRIAVVWNRVWDWKSAIVRCCIWSAVLAAIYFAVGKQKS